VLGVLVSLRGREPIRAEFQARARRGRLSAKINRPAPPRDAAAA